MRAECVRPVSVAVTLIAAALCMLTGCGRTDKGTGLSGQVVVYSSVDDLYCRPVLNLFTERTGIAVKLVSDTEETKSTDLLNRLLAEKARPVADVFWSGEPVRAAVLQQHAFAARYFSPQSKELPKEFSDVDGNYTGFSARVRVIIFNRSLFPSGGEPRSIFDLVEPRHSGKGCIANPLFGTTSMHAAALFQVLGEEKAKEFFARLLSNKVKMLSSNGEVRRRVAAGEYAFGLTDSDDVNVALKDGKQVGFVLPDQEGIGTLVVPNAVVLVANGPNMENGKKLIDFLLSEEIERLLAQSDAAQIPLRPGVPGPKMFPTALTTIRTMKVDYVELAKRTEYLSAGFLKQWVDDQSKK